MKNQETTNLTASAHRIETREQLLSALAEAAELEHSLMCLYLYAVFSLKTRLDQSLTVDELRSVTTWRKDILGIAIQEMGHLSLVANLTSAVGGSAHFFHPPFPASPGYYPSDFVVELAGFSKETLKHFIFLERSHEMHQISDAPQFQPAKEFERVSPENRLMSHPGQYETVGELYEAIKIGLRKLEADMGQTKLFCGDRSLQLSAKDIEMEGLTQITNLSEALLAIDVIVEQGEGSKDDVDSHFAKFKKIETEYNQILATNSNFVPAIQIARNPVMRKPAIQQNVLWISHPQTAPVLDIGNALYSLMLRVLMQVYTGSGRASSDKKLLLESAFALMHGIAIVGTALTELPASQADPSVGAGLSFTLNRHFTALELRSEKNLILERVNEIMEATGRLDHEMDHKDWIHQLNTMLRKISKALSS